MWSVKVKQFVMDMTAWLGMGLDIVLVFVGVETYVLAIVAAAVAAAITIEGLFPVKVE